MEKTFQIEVKNGLYIGDLCYAIADDVYDNVWGGADYKDDAYVEPKTGLMFAMVGTCYGDGEYKDSISKYYFPVDAGIIGICDLGLVAKTGDWGRVLPNVKGEVTINYKDGRIKVWQTVINTHGTKAKAEKFLIANINTNC